MYVDFALSFALLLVPVGLQVYYWLRAQGALATIRGFSQGGHSEYTQLVDSIAVDIGNRARRGQPSDWIAYLDHFDRLYEPRVEKISQLAGSALATGVGGTMFIFAVELAFGDFWEPTTNPDTLEVKRIALFGLASSIVGILVHLLIVLRTLRAAQDSLERASLVFRSDIWGLINRASDAPSLGEGIRLELSEAFAEGMRRFPEAFKHVGAGLREIQVAVVARLDEFKEVNQHLAARFEEFTSTANELSATASQIHSIGTHVEETASVLETMPGRLQASISESASVWGNEVKAAHAGFIDPIQDTLLQHVKLLRETRTRQDQLVEQFNALALLLENLPKSLGDAHTGLAEKFAHQSRNYIIDLRKEIASGTQELVKTVETNRTKWDQWFVSSSARIVEDIFKSLAAQIDNTIREPLKSMGTHLKRTTEALPGAASEFTTSMDEFSGTLKGVPEKLKSTAEDVQDATQSINELTSRLEDTLASATQVAWEPASKEMAEFARTARITHADLRRTISHLIKFIKELISRVNA